ncbi:MAG: MFS transporter [Actinomycetota bacterium]
MTSGAEPVASSPTPPPWREVFSGARGRLTAGLLLLEALVAIEALIVVTVLPAVEQELGGLALYGWTFTALTLASIGTVPMAGRLTDRIGPTPVLGLSMVLYVGGLLVAAAAPSMAVVVAGRFVQGIGGGGLYTVSLAAVAKTYPDRIRPRVMALLASMWILPGLLGPILGSVIAEALSWRWAFIVPIPAIVLGVLLVIPALRGMGAEPNEERLPVAPSLLLMAGTALVLAGLTRVTPATIVLVPAGLAVGLPGLVRITPPGTLVARPGPAAAAAAAFLASSAFLAVDGFLTLMLTNVRGLSIGEAGLIVTAAAFSWAAGSWYASRVTGRRGARWITTSGALVMAAGTILVAGGLLPDLPIAIPYAGWALGGLGMGMVFPTVPLSVMSEATRGREAGELSSIILMDFLGVGVGAGLGGACVALADAGTISLEAGIAGAFGIGLLSAVLLALVGRRIPDARPVDSAT